MVKATDTIPTDSKQAARRQRLISCNTAAESLRSRIMQRLKGVGHAGLAVTRSRKAGQDVFIIWPEGLPGVDDD